MGGRDRFKTGKSELGGAGLWPCNKKGSTAIVAILTQMTSRLKWGKCGNLAGGFVLQSLASFRAAYFNVVVENLGKFICGMMPGLPDVLSALKVACGYFQASASLATTAIPARMTTRWMQSGHELMGQTAARMSSRMVCFRPRCLLLGILHSSATAD